MVVSGVCGFVYVVLFCGCGVGLVTEDAARFIFALCYALVVGFNVLVNVALANVATLLIINHDPREVRFLAGVFF